jgi:hypothetical protein
MAIMDKLVEFADEFDISAVGTAGTKNLTNQIDLQVVRDIGNGEPVYLVVAVGATEVITGGNAGTIEVQLVSDDSASIATDGSASLHYASQAFVTDDADANDAALSAGKVLVCVPLPLDGGEPYERYLGVQIVIATTTITAGTLNAWLSLTPVHSPRHYPKAAG